MTQQPVNLTKLILDLHSNHMKSHCVECSFVTEEPGELYVHFMNEHTKIKVKAQSNLLNSFDG